MDELTFRRHVLADPFTQDPKIVHAAHQDPAKQQFWHAVKAQEEELKRALHIAVPDDLADKLLWEQVSQSPAHRVGPVVRYKRPIWFALAASLILTISIGWNNFHTNDSTFYAEIIAHIEHVSEHEITGEVVSLAMVNNKLAKFGGVINAAFGRILSVNYCVIDGIESLHVQMGNPDNPTSVFILPKEVSITPMLNINANSKYDDLQGQILEYQSANVLVLGQVSQTFATITQQLSQHLAFTR